MARRLRGRTDWSMERDEEGHRTYKITHLVETELTDGPYMALRTPNLPLPGTPWLYGGDDDPWAFCKLIASVKPAAPIKQEAGRFFEVEQTFSTKPDGKSCKDIEILHPLLEPQKISGTFTKFQEEATHDMFGDRILNSAHEQMRGPQNEWDANRPQVRIEQNVNFLDLDLFSQMVDTVNAYPLWGLPPRTIKLSNVSWERQFYGQCYVYYKRTMEFDIRYRRRSRVIAVPGTGTATSFGTGGGSATMIEGAYEDFDRELLDEGTKVLRGHWDFKTTGVDSRWILDRVGGQLPDKTNPSHFIRFQDPNGNVTRVILDGAGRPAEVRIVGTGSASSTSSAGITKTQIGSIFVQRYGESDFLLLGIPTRF